MRGFCQHLGSTRHYKWLPDPPDLVHTTTGERAPVGSMSQMIDARFDIEEA